MEKNYKLKSLKEGKQPSTVFAAKNESSAQNKPIGTASQQSSKTVQKEQLQKVTVQKDGNPELMTESQKIALHISNCLHRRLLKLLAAKLLANQLVNL